MKHLAAILALLTAAPLLVPAPAAAQEWGVVRRSFTFVDNTLSVEVRAGVPGELQIVRGGFGQVEVAARSDRGIAGMALSGRSRDELVLTAMGGDRVDYLVMVPENARVRIRVPGLQWGETFWPPQEQARFEWGRARPAASTAATMFAGIGSAPQAAAVADSGRGSDPETPFVSFAGGRTPELVEVPDPSDIGTLRVRVEGQEFRVETGRPTSAQGGGRSVLEIRAAGEPLDVVLVVPTATPMFTLRFGDAEALRIRGGRAEALCSPVLTQRLDGGREWFTYTRPQDGSFACER